MLATELINNIPKLQYYKIKNQCRTKQNHLQKILVIDDDRDSNFSFKLGLEDEMGHGDKFNSNIRSAVGSFVIKYKTHIT